MTRLLILSWLGVLVMALVALVPDFAITLFLSWLALAAMHGLACLLER